MTRAKQKTNLLGLVSGPGVEQASSPQPKAPHVKPKSQSRTEKLRLQCESLETELKTLKQDYEKLSPSIEALKWVFQKCKSCGKRMTLMEWNSQVYILACDNSRCTHYRRPASEIGKEALFSMGLLDERPDSSDKYSRIDMRLKTRKPRVKSGVPSV